MPRSKTPYGWMALGGLLCLLGFGLACKWRDGSQVRAQSDTPPGKAESTPVVPTPDDGTLPPAPSSADRLAPTASSMPKDDDATPLPGIKNDNSPKPDQKQVMPTLTIPIPPATSGPANPVVQAGFEEKKDLPPLPGGNSMPPSPAPRAIGPEMVTPGGLLDNKGVDSAPPPLVGTLPPQDLPDNKGVGSTPPALPPTVKSSVPEPADGKDPGMDHKAVAPAVNVSVPMVVPPVTPIRGETRSDEGEPPLAPSPGPVQMYQVRQAQETLRDIARRTLGDAERWKEIYKLNPSLKPEEGLNSGAFVRLPSDACVPPEEVGDVKPLPLLRPDAGPPKPKVLMPLTGTYPCNLDDKRLIALPRAIRDQLVGEGEIVLVSPGPDHCLWLTTQDHLERLAKRMEASQAREHEVRSFRRLYFAQTEKMTVSAEGRILIPERLAQFAGLHQEVVLIGIDDHFELWDVARWRQYTQAKSATARSAMSDD
jgi:MraZ protein